MLFWDPNPIAFHIPIINFDVYWYSLLFGLGFVGSYFLVLKDVQKKCEKKAAIAYTDRLALFIFFGILLGARLGHVFFYDWAYFSMHPGEIFSIPMRGLASHGAVVGILIALALFWKTSQKILSPTQLLDSIARVAAFAGGCIRLGNFMNQEILGTASTLPWAVTFGHPMEHVSGPCHPVQLYEALFYFGTFVFLYLKKDTFREGTTTGLLLIMIFSFRFCIEFFKLPQSDFYLFGLNMGQLLSLPLIAFGGYLLYIRPVDMRFKKEYHQRK